jgi:aminocarboxymuconate-semialdehyde decarboxylase
MKIVDTQSHWYPRPLLDAYAEFPDLYPGCERDGDNYRVEALPGKMMSLGPRFTDLDLQLQIARAAGVTTIVSSSASFGDVDMLPVARAREVAVAVNEERARAEKKHPEFIGLATVPWQSADAAIEVLDDAVKRLGLRGALIHSTVTGQPLDSEYLEPVYARLEQLSTPLFLHPGRTVLGEAGHDFGLEFLVGYMFDTSLAALRLVFSGILDRHPRLKVIHPHAGATLPYLAGRIDSSYWKPSALNRRLPEPPSVLLSTFYTDTMCQSPETLRYAARFYGYDHLLYGSDYPYFDPEESIAFVRQTLPEEQLEGVFYGNAAKLLGL